MGSIFLSFCYLCVATTLLSFVRAANANNFSNNVIRGKEFGKTCDIFHGSWVYDPTYPLFDSSSCLSIRREFDCKKYGRPDDQYLKYRWQPSNCNLPRFNGEEFLERFKGKRIMFIGDSLSLNFWQSLVCLLHAANPKANITREDNASITSFTFQDHGVSVMIFHSLYLVDIEEERDGRVLKLDSIKNGNTWKNMDVLIFETYQWWGRRGPQQPWDYIEEGGKMYKDMDRMEAFHKGLATWAKWADSNIYFAKTRLFFQGISPSHYNGSEWNDPGVTNCAKETQPVKSSTYPGGRHPATTIVNDVLGTMKIRPYLLDFTTLSQLRKDGHPSSYSGLKGMDCTHWCIPGLPDTWSNLLYAALIS